MKLKFILILVVFFLLAKTNAQDTAFTSLFDKSLEELLNLEVNIASLSKSYNLKEAPAVISVINEFEIKNTGAKDLIEILKLVPGIDFGTDVNGVVSLIYRGIWVQEGKALLMIDGQPINEMLYGCNHLGLELPVENISRIEILRGPGSATYGDYAEMLVINVITKHTLSNNGYIGGYFSSTDNKLFFKNSIYGSLNKSFGNINLNLFYRYASGSRSNFDYTDKNGNSYNLLENSIGSSHLNLKINYKKLSFLTILNNYRLRERDHFGTNLSKPYPNYFDTYLSEISYTPKITNSFRLITTLNFKYDNPWYHVENNLPAVDSGIFNNNHINVIRIKSRVFGIYEYNKLVLSLGGEISYDISKNFLDYHWNGKNIVEYYTTSAIGQISYNSNLANLILESRFDKHNLYGGVFAPRIALTKSFGWFNYKLLWNRAFRAPTIENLNLNYKLYPQYEKPILKPEISNVFNLQIGFNILEIFNIQLSGFYSKITNPIVYLYKQNGEGYDNYSTTGTNGVEGDLFMKYNKVYFKISASYYNSKDIFTGKPLNYVEDYLIVYNADTLKNQLLGSPKVKSVVFVSYDLTKKFNITATGEYYSSKYGYMYDNGFKIVKINPQFFINFAINGNITNNLNLQLSCLNLLNTQYYYFQPYNGGHSPLIGPGREYMIKLTYIF